MKKLFLPLAAALALTACGGTTPTTGGSTDQIVFDFVDTSDDFNFLNPGVIQLNLSQPANFTVAKITIERDDTNDGVDNYHLIDTVRPSSYPSIYNDTVTTSGTYAYRVTAYNSAGQTIATTAKITLPVEVPQATQGGTLKETANALTYPLTKTAWTGGAGKIALETTAASPIASTDLAADGTFQFDLSTATPSAAQLVTAASDVFLGGVASQCSGDVSISTSLNATAKMTLAHARVTANKSGLAIPYMTLPPIEVNTTKNIQLAVGEMIYVDHPVYFKGAKTCQLTNNDYETVVKFDLMLHKGWNPITAQTITDSRGRMTSISWANKFPSGGNDEWVFFNTLPTITP